MKEIRKVMRRRAIADSWRGLMNLVYRPKMSGVWEAAEAASAGPNSRSFFQCAFAVSQQRCGGGIGRRKGYESQHVGVRPTYDMSSATKQ